MKRFVYAIAFVATLFFSSSCEEVMQDGNAFTKFTISQQ